MSSSDIAIHVEDLGKMYRIGRQQRRAATRVGRLRQKAAAPFSWLESQLRGPSEEETLWALRDVSFDVKHGEVLGVIGRNGAGKSTLLKILSQITEPTEGQADMFGRVAALLEVGTGMHPDLTGRENVYLNGCILGMRKAEIRRKFDDIVAFAEIERFIDTPVKRYSSGMRVRLGFAIAAHLESEILLIDEVLAVGDGEFQAKCLGRTKEVAAHGRTVLFVSHNMSAVRALCSRTLLFDAGRLEMHGDTDAMISGYVGKASSDIACFHDGPLRSVRVLLEGNSLIVKGEYRTPKPVALPCLGFTISNAYGQPITTATPHISRIWQAPAPSSAGHVVATLRAPRLLDGTYSLSAWFGVDDHDPDLVEYPDCLLFEVAGMAGERQLRPHHAGPVFPDCDWDFFTDEGTLSPGTPN